MGLGPGRQVLPGPLARLWTPGPGQDSWSDNLNGCISPGGNILMSTRAPSGETYYYRVEVEARLPFFGALWHFLHAPRSSQTSSY